MDASLKKAALEKKPAMVILNPLNICVAGLPMGMIVFLIIFTMVLGNLIADDFDDDADDHWHEGEAWCPYNWPSRTPGRPASTWSLSSSPALSSVSSMSSSPASSSSPALS